MDDFNRVENEFDELVDSLRSKRIDLIKKSIQFCIDNLTSFLESDEDRVLELRKVLGCSRNVLGKCKEEIPKARGEIKSLMSELRRRAAQSINVIVPKLEGALSGDGEDEYESSSSEI